ncbi:hypothetical protein BZL39_K05370 [Zygosaccharomyces parabailii]|nr:hypothetical protein BZL39_K05370 [Zygosaccharomyces parabailii]
MCSAAKTLKFISHDSEYSHKEREYPSLSETLESKTNLDKVLPVQKRLWIFVPHLLRLNLLIVVPLSASCLNGFDGAILNSFQSMETWTTYMGNPQGAILGALVCGLPFGLLMSIWIAPCVSDRFGRKITTYCRAVATIIGVAIQTCAVNYASFFISRIVVGWGIGFYMISAPALITEIAYPKYRPMCVSFFNTTWYLGSIMASWIAYGTHFMTESQFSWRIPALIQCVFPVFHIIFLHFVPESPRYLVSRGKIQDVKEFLLKYHAGKSPEEESPLVTAQRNPDSSCQQCTRK